MSRFLTIECDSNEIRLAIGSSGLTGVSIERVLSDSLSLEEGSDPWGSPTALTTLKSLLQQAGIKSGEAIACVSRNDIELRAITLPDVDTNELPDMVRLQPRVTSPMSPIPGLSTSLRCPRTWRGVSTVSLERSTQRSYKRSSKRSAKQV